MNTQPSQNELFIFTTSRKKRLFLRQAEGLPPKALTIGEFIKRAVYIDGYSFADDATKKLLLSRASNFRHFANLGVPTSFLKFLKNTSFFFGFFNELAFENVEIDALRESDTYQDYEEHLQILKKLKANYEDLLEQGKLIDTVNLTKKFRINADYLGSFSAIYVIYDGYLNSFEKSIFEVAAKITKTVFELELSPYDKKLLDLFAFKLNLSHKETLDLSAKSQRSKPKSAAKISAKLYSASTQLEQISHLKDAVFDMVERGISPKNIVVVLADEGFAQTLKIFDDELNFNFAGGISFTRTKIYKYLDAIARYKAAPNAFNAQRLKHYKDEHQAVFLDGWDKKARDFTKVFDKLRVQDPSQRQIFKNQLFSLKKILSAGDLKLSEFFDLLLGALAGQKLDHTGGGKITVTGILETRQLEFEGVIVLDFSDACVPKNSVKDLFITSNIRQRTGLNTSQDRQNYQKSLYYKLFAGARALSIIFTQNDETRQSNFIRLLGISELPFKRRLFPLFASAPSRSATPPGEIALDVDLAAQPVSPKKLSTYLTCKRKFYFYYIKKLRHEDPSDAAALGSGIHGLLERLYAQKGFFASFEELERKFLQELSATSFDDIRQEFEFKVWRGRFRKFLRQEFARFESGFRVEKTEAPVDFEYGGIKFTGKADRVDRLGAELYVLDYKTGNYEHLKKPGDATREFSLLIYGLAFGTKNVGIYDLKSSLVKMDEYFDERLELFKQALESYRAPRQNFELTQDLSVCTYCQYKNICKR